MDSKQILEELTSLRKLRDALNERIISLEKQQRYIVQSKVASNGAIYNGVLAADLKPYIQEWIDEGKTIRTLADKAMISETTIERIMKLDTTTVRITTADAIITALDVPHILNRIVPDPPESVYYEE